MPTYKGLSNLAAFIGEFEDRVSEPKRLLELEEALKDTSTRWWDTHKTSKANWKICQQPMEVRFGEDEYYQGKRYDGRNNPSNHLATCQTTWKLSPMDEWVHAFIHTLDETPQRWYVSAELQ